MIHLSNNIGYVDFDEFVEMLYDAGWRATADAQHSNIAKLYDDLVILRSVPHITGNIRPSFAKDEYLEYIDKISRSGKPVAIRDLMDCFDLSHIEAKLILQYWNLNFNKRRM